MLQREYQLAAQIYTIESADGELLVLSELQAHFLQVTNNKLRLSLLQFPLFVIQKHIT